MVADRGPLVVSILLFSCAVSAQEIPPLPLIAAPASSSELRLDLIINGHRAGRVIAATALPDGSIAVRRDELESVGIRSVGRGGSALVDLRASGLTYSYDEPRQSLSFNVSDAQRLPTIYDVRGDRPPVPPPVSSWGALLNYSVFAASSSAMADWAPKVSTANLYGELRLFSPVGSLVQTGIVGNTLNYDLLHFGGNSGLRLDTTYTYADPDTLVMYRAGDVISGGFEWSRPIRLGGVQIQRNFGLRADMVTAAVPSVSGSAAVPSAVDVFVNGARMYSQQVGEGPFRITNLPIASSDAQTEVVVRDVTGRETRASVSLLSPEKLLAKGLLDFSLETGLARRSYATLSSDYDLHPVGAASMRYGLLDFLTLQGHAEGGAGLVNAGLGGVTRLNRFGVMTTAASYSRVGGASGLQIFGAYSVAGPLGVTLNASSQRTFQRYEDLASVTAPRAGSLTIGAPAVSFGLDLRQARAMDRVSLSLPVPQLKGTVNLSFAQIQRDGTSSPEHPSLSRLVSATYARSLPFGIDFFVAGVASVSGHGSKGVYAGLTFPLGGAIRGGVAVQSSQNVRTGTNALGATAQVQKPSGSEVGSYGWTLDASQGDMAVRGASGTYRSSLGTARVDARQQGGIASASAQFDGSVALVGSSLAAGPRVNDSFAVISAGASGVAVLHDNRPMGQTNVFGSLLVPALRSYERNKISIDPATLPDDAVPDTTEQIVAPMYQSGVRIDFGVNPNVKSATYTLVNLAGKAIETGSRGHIDGGKNPFIVGYDGSVYVRGLAETNMLIVDLGDHDCRAVVTLAASGGPITCQ